MSAENISAFSLEPLGYISEEEALPNYLREAAVRSTERIENRRWKPKSVIGHGGLWIGNLLLPRDREARRLHRWRFIVIDWGGAQMVGYPILDLVRLLGSSRVPISILRHEITIQCKTLGCELVDAESYLLSGLGALGMSLEHFPRSRYLPTTVSAFDTLRAAIR